MQKEIVMILLLTFIVIIDGQDDLCKSYENNIYQATITFPNYAPSYALITILPNGLAYHINNIDAGLNTAELGLEMKFSTHIGYYKCLNQSAIYLMDIGYLFKVTDIAVLSSSDRISRHNYHLYFPDNNNTFCTGDIQFTFYATNSDPYDSTDRQVFSTSVGTVTCQLFEGRHYIWPTTSK